MALSKNNYDVLQERLTNLHTIPASIKVRRGLWLLYLKTQWQTYVVCLKELQSCGSDVH